MMIRAGSCARRPCEIVEFLRVDIVFLVEYVLDVQVEGPVVHLIAYAEINNRKAGILPKRVIIAGRIEELCVGLGVLHLVWQIVVWLWPQPGALL